MIEDLRRVVNDATRPIQLIALAVAVRFVGAGLAVLVHLVLARLMGVEDYGVFIFSYTALLMVGTLALAGLDRTIARFSAAAWAKQDYSAARGIVVIGTAVAFASAVLWWIAVGLTLIVTEFPSIGVYQTALLIGAASIPLFVLHRMREGAANGLRLMGHVTVPEHLVRQPLLLALTATFAWICTCAPSAEEVMGLYVLSMIILVVAGSLALYTALPPDFQSRPAVVRGWRWLKTSPAMMLSGGMELIFAQIDIIVVGVLLGGKAAALYAVASRFSNLLIYVSRAIDLVTLPVAAAGHTREDLSELQHLATAAGRVGTLFVGLGVIVIWLIGEDFLRLFGNEYVVASHIAVLLAFSCFCRVLLGPGATVLSATGHHNTSAATTILAIAVNTLLSVTLVHALGMIGAALATLASTVLLGTLNALVARRRTGVLTVVH